MESVKNWILTIVTVAVAGSVILMISPTGNMQKNVKTVISLFLLMAFILPMARGEIPQFDWEDTLVISENSISENSDQILRKITASEVENSVAEILNDNNIAYYDIDAQFTINNNEINITKIVIELDTSNSVTDEKVKSVIKEEFGNDVDIEVRND